MSNRALSNSLVLMPCDSFADDCTFGELPSFLQKRIVRVSVLNDALKTMYNAEKHSKQQVMTRPSSKVMKFLLVMQKHGYIGEFEFLDNHRDGKIVVELNGRLKKYGIITSRFDVGVERIEPCKALPTGQFSYIMQMTSVGIMDAEVGCMRVKVLQM